MFRLATQTDIWNLFEETGGLWPDGQAERIRFGLKSFGYMLTLKQVRALAADLSRRPNILEAGAGMGDVLFTRVRAIADYTAVDKAGFYNAETFEAAVARRAPSRTVDALMGDFKRDELPDASFDLTCSVSVIEHVPIDRIPACVEDCARVTRPGGLFVHTLDIYKSQAAIWEAYQHEIGKYFEFIEAPEPIDFTADGLLYESVRQVFNVAHKNPKKAHLALRHNWASVAIIARRG